MASEAELYQQLTATENAIAALRKQYSAATPGSVSQTQILTAINRLLQQRVDILKSLENYVEVSNPPDPTVPITPTPSPTVKTINAASQTNPPDPTVDDAALTPLARVEQVRPANTESVVPVTAGQPPIPVASIQRQPDNNFVYDPNTGELLPGDSAQAEQVRQESIQNTLANNRVLATQPMPLGGDYTEVYNPETSKWDVYDLANPDIPVATGLTQQEAILQAEERSVGDPGYGLPTGVQGPLPQTQASLRADDYQARSVNAQALLTAARDQATLAEQRKAAGTAAGDGDWRVRLRLAPQADYLYKSGAPGIMAPLADTDGVVFPYTPRIDTVYSAEYSPYDLTHSNYRGYFYKGSRVGEVILTASFTAQDTFEANYMLATIQFFKSCTKMFYGQDAERGSPPPLVYLSGLGEFQFNEHPCVISNFNYNLPDDVDYIRARSTMASSSGVTQGGNGLMYKQPLSGSSTLSNSTASTINRLLTAAQSVSNFLGGQTSVNALLNGAMTTPPAPANLGLNSPTYVPTKMTMTLTLLPIQSRQQISQQFSLKGYASGSLLKGGFW